MIPSSNNSEDYPLTSIYFYPTESCNLKCMHCWIHPEFTPNRNSYQRQNRENVSVETMERVVQDALPLGLSHIKFTGGEPFLNPELFSFLDSFSRYGLSFTIETNGTLLTKSIVQRLKEYNIRLLSLSLDGSIPKTHDKIRGVKGSLEKAVHAIQLLIESEINPQIIFCLQKSNAADLEETIRLAYKLKVKSFEINPLALLEENYSKKKGCEGLPIEELLLLEKKIEKEFPKRYPGMHIDLYIPPALKGMKELSLNKLSTCNVLNICGILSNGDVSMCGVGRRKRAMVVGNVKVNSVAQIWKGGTLFREIREKVPSQLKGICGSCLFKYHCLGFCRADVLFNGQSLLDPNNFCEETFQKGLFPKSRVLDWEKSRKVHDNGIL